MGMEESQICAVLGGYFGGCLGHRGACLMLGPRWCSVTSHASRLLWGLRTDTASLPGVLSRRDQGLQGRGSKGGQGGGVHCCLVMAREGSGALPRTRAGRLGLDANTAPL